MPHEFLLSLAREPGDAGKVEIGGNQHALILAQRSHVGILPFDISRIPRVDLELRANGRRDAIKLWPDGCETIEVDARKGQELEGASAGGHLG